MKTYQEASQAFQATADVVTVKRTAKTWTVKIVGSVGNASICLLLHEAQDGILVALASRYKAAPARLKDVIEAAIAGLLPRAKDSWVRTLGIEDATVVYQTTLARINALMFDVPKVVVKETAPSSQNSSVREVKRAAKPWTIKTVGSSCARSYWRR